MRTRNGDTALVEIHEYRRLHVNDVTGRGDPCLAEDSVRNTNAYSYASLASAASVGADWAHSVINSDFECHL